jgi:hypothetical protein
MITKQVITYSQPYYRLIAKVQVPVSQLKSYGDCAFSVTAPTLWNKLPANIRKASSLENFKSRLKTHLFKVSFTDK